MYQCTGSCTQTKNKAINTHTKKEIPQAASIDTSTYVLKDPCMVGLGFRVKNDTNRSQPNENRIFGHFDLLQLLNKSSSMSSHRPSSDGVLQRQFEVVSMKWFSSARRRHHLFSCHHRSHRGARISCAWWAHWGTRWLLSNLFGICPCDLRRTRLSINVKIWKGTTVLPAQ